MSRHLRLIAVCAGLLASTGCSRERRLPTAPPPLFRPDRTVPEREDPHMRSMMRFLAALSALTWIAAATVRSQSPIGREVAVPNHHALTRPVAALPSSRLEPGNSAGGGES
jgi:hypothetical protein